MSTVHGSPYWHPASIGAQSFTKVDDQNLIQGWEIKNSPDFTIKTRICGHILTDLFDHVVKIVKEQIHEAPQEKKGLPFSVNPMPTLEEIINGVCKGPSYKGKIKDLTDQACQIVKTYIADRRGMGALAFLLSDGSVRTSNRFLFNYSMKKQQLDQWYNEMSIDGSSYMFQAMKVHSLGICAFNEEEIEFFGGTQAVSSIDPTKISCFAYALLQKRDPMAKKLIFAKEDSEMDIKTLKDLGYRIVSRPNVGDLVFYMDKTSTKGKHLALFAEDEEKGEAVAISKWGINNSEIYKQSIFDVPSNYSDRVVFLRKFSAII